MVITLPVSTISQPIIVVDPNECAFDLPYGMNEGGVLNISNDGDSLLTVEASQGDFDQDFTLSIVIWTRFADFNWSYQNLLISLAALPVGYRITEYAGNNPDDLSRLLNSAHVLLLPFQVDANLNDIHELGRNFRDILEDFIYNRSGFIVCVDHEDAGSEFLQGADLIDIQVLDVVDQLIFESVDFHPVNAGIHRYSASSACNLHTCDELNSVVVSRDTLEGNANITAKTMGNGGIVYMGLSWLQYNQAMTQLLLNSVMWSQGGSSWLVLDVDDFIGMIEPHDSQDMFFRVDAGMVREPGSYNRSIILTSNDARNPSLRIPVHLEVSHPLPHDVVISLEKVFVITDAESDTTVTMVVRNNGPGVFMCDVILSDDEQDWLRINRTSLLIWPDFEPRLLLFFHPDSTDDEMHTNWVQFKIPNSDSVLYEIPVFYYTGQDFGSLDGSITNTEDNSPIQGAQIDVHGLVTISDQNGGYAFEQVPPFNYMITASHPDYLSQTSGWIRIQRDRITSVDFNLQYCTLEHGFQNPVVERLKPGTKLIVEDAFTNNGTGVLEFNSIFTDQNPQEKLQPWERRLELSAVDSLDADQIAGVAFSGGYFVMAGTHGQDESIYILDRDGSVVNSYPQPDGHPFGMADLTCDNNLVYGTGINQLIGFDIEGNVRSRISTPLNYNRAIAYNPENDLFITANNRSDFVIIDRYGYEIDRIDNPGLSIFGLAWWSNQPDGYSLVMFCREGPYDSQVNLMNIESEDTRFIREISSDFGERAGGVAITSGWDYRHWSLVFQLNGGRNRTEVYNLTDLSPWAYMEPNTGSIESGAHMPVSIHFNTAGFHDEIQAEGYFTVIGSQRGGSDTINVVLQIGEDAVPPDNNRKTGIPSQLSMNAYPNPSNGYVKVDYRVQPATHSLLQVFDINGRQVFNVEIPPASNGQGSMMLNFENRSTGLYLIRLESGNERRIQRVLLMK